jgi:hypothetical protein
MPKRQRALRIEVQICAPKPSQYRLEIYDGDELDAIKLSQAGNLPVLQHSKAHRWRLGAAGVRSPTTPLGGYPTLDPVPVLPRWR